MSAAFPEFTAVPARIEGRAFQIEGSTGLGDNTTYYNSSTDVFILQELDFAERYPTEGDTWDLYLTQALIVGACFWGGGVGAGAVGTFVDRWQGMMVFGPNQGLNFQTTAASGGSSGQCSIIASGYWLSSYAPHSWVS